MYELVPVLVLALLVGAFGTFLIVLTNYLGRKVHQHYGGTSTKYESYECGLDAQSTGDTKISVKFYLTAILFILFDIEIIFMYPWAVSFTEFINSGIGPEMFIAMSIFLLVFIYGLIWEIQSNALEWE